jgi:hypothetical protein
MICLCLNSSDSLSCEMISNWVIIHVILLFYWADVIVFISHSLNFFFFFFFFLTRYDLRVDAKWNGVE